MKKELFSVHDISKRLDNDLKIERISLRVYSGEILGICAMNTVQRNVLVNILSGEERADSGEILIDGIKMEQGNILHTQIQGLYCISAQDRLVSDFTVAENMYVMKPHLFRYCGNKRKVYTIMEDFLVCNKILIKADKKVRYLSEVEKKVVEVMRAVIRHARILILHDALVHFTENEKYFFLSLLQDLRNQGLTIILIGLDIGAMDIIADRIFIMREGRLEGEFYRGEYVGDAVRQALVCGYEQEKIVDKCVQDTTILLEWEKISVPYGICDCSGYVCAGETVGFMRADGKPVTDIFRILNGEAEFNGKILLEGKSIKIVNRAEAVKNGIGSLSGFDKQEALFPNMTIGENLMLMKYREYSNCFTLVKEATCRFAIYEYLRDFDIAEELLTRYPNELDYYDRAIIMFVKWLIVEPKLILVEEPYADAVAGMKKSFSHYMRMAHNRGIGILYVSPMKEEMRRNCDRIYTFKDGHVIDIVNKNN